MRRSALSFRFESLESRKMMTGTLGLRLDTVGDQEFVDFTYDSTSKADSKSTFTSVVEPAVEGALNVWVDKNANKGWIGFSDGIVEIHGTNVEDTARVLTYGDEIRVSLENVYHGASYPFRFLRKSDVAEIRFYANDGDDSFYNHSSIRSLAEGGRGDDFLYGGDGVDDLRGREGTNTLYGQDGDDFLYGGEEVDRIYGGLGADLIAGFGGDDKLYGDLYGVEDEGSRDIVDGGTGDDDIWGAGGWDFLWGGEGVDEIWGGVGTDTIIGGHDTDYLYGGDGGDNIHGDYNDSNGNGWDHLFGEGGEDRLYGNRGVDTINGGPDRDWIFGGPDSDKLYGNGGHDLIYGGGGKDDLYGEEGSDWLYGEAGDDSMYGGELVDHLFGGPGSDTMFGGEGDDQLTGGADNDRLYGNQGNDYLYGQSGLDGLFGGEGLNTLDGGADADRYLTTDDPNSDGIGQIILNRDESDAVLYFPNYMWINAGFGWIIQVDEAFHMVHLMTGNVKLLQTPAGNDLQFNYSQFGSGEGGLGGSYDNAGNITLYGIALTDSLDHVVLHELAHVWDSQSEIFQEFKAISGWKKSGQDWKFQNGPFVTDYAMHSPTDDFAETFAAVVMAEYDRPMYDLTAGGDEVSAADIPVKAGLMLDWIASLAVWR